MADPVKSEPNLVTCGRSFGPISTALLALAVTCWTGNLEAQNLLLGPVARRIKAKVELDPRLPTGAIRHQSVALPSALPRACSFDLPVCVAFDRENEPRAHQALDNLETAYRRLVYALRLPPPLERAPLVLQLDSRAPGFTTSLVRSPGAAFEQASLICRSDAGTAVARDAWLCVGEAIAARLDAAESPRLRRAYAEAIAWEYAEPSEYDPSKDETAVARANRRPERTLVGREDVEAAPATALFLAYLEQALGSQGSGSSLTTGLFALSAQPAEPVRTRFNNEPDWLDVLRASLEETPGELGRRINAFAAARNQLSQGRGPLANLAWLGTQAPLSLAWELKASGLPRRVAAPRPLEPLGMVAILIDLDIPTQDLNLALRMEWETPVPFTWAVVKLDAEGRELGRIDLAFEPRVTSAEKQLTAFEDTRKLLIVGTNLGGIDASHLLDPDHAPFEPHGCTLYATKL